MNRFYHDKPHWWGRQFFAAALFLAFLLLFTSGVSQVSKETNESQAEMLEQAVSRGIAHCYAANGRYPESLTYLLDHYDIFYDEDIFFIDYQVLGENIFPDVTIIRKQEIQ